MKAALLRLGRIPRRWANEAGAASSEFAMTAPILFVLIAVILFGGVGFEINRKLTLTMRTLTDLASQQTNIGTSTTTYTYTQILNAASLVIAPYDSTQLSMVLSEIQTNGTTTGKVIWSKANSNGTALTTGSNVTVPSTLTASGYLILGTVSYTYNPVNLFGSVVPAVTMSNQIYLTPRASASIACCN